MAKNQNSETAEKYVPQFKDLFFSGKDGKSHFAKWLRDTRSYVVHLMDFGQDLLMIHVHESGEILHCNAQGNIYNGMFVNLEKLQNGECLEMYIRDLGSFEPFVRLVIDLVTGPQNEENPSEPSNAN